MTSASVECLKGTFTQLVTQPTYMPPAGSSIPHYYLIIGFIRAFTELLPTRKPSPEVNRFQEGPKRNEMARGKTRRDSITSENYKVELSLGEMDSRCGPHTRREKEFNLR